MKTGNLISADVLTEEEFSGWLEGVSDANRNEEENVSILHKRKDKRVRKLKKRKFTMKMI